MIFWILACGQPAVRPEPGSPPSPVAETPAPAAEVPPRPRPERIAARHILVSFEGTAASKPRSRADAEERVREALTRLQAGEDFAELAKQYSDDSTAARGGWLGAATFDSWVPEFSEAAFSLEEGQMSGVVESLYGFHIIKREPLIEVHLRHIVVQWSGVRWLEPGSPAAVRTREEAKAIAEAALVELDQGQPFEEVCARRSDGPMAKRGGDLGVFIKGELGPEFDRVAFALAPGQRSQIVETVFGFHVVERLP